MASDYRRAGLTTSGAAIDEKTWQTVVIEGRLRGNYASGPDRETLYREREGEADDGNRRRWPKEQLLFWRVVSLGAVGT